MSDAIPKDDTVAADEPKPTFLRALSRCTHTLTAALGVIGFLYALFFSAALVGAGQLTLWGWFNLCLVLLLGILLFADVDRLLRNTEKGVISAPAIVLLVLAALVKPEIFLSGLRPWDFFHLFERFNVFVLVYTLFRCLGRAFITTEKGTAINPMLNRSYLAEHLTRAILFAATYRIAKMVVVVSTVVLGVMVVFITN
jgi:hypothetical protein